MSPPLHVLLETDPHLEGDAGRDDTISPKDGLQVLTELHNSHSFSFHSSCHNRTLNQGFLLKKQIIGLIKLPGEAAYKSMSHFLVFLQKVKLLRKIKANCDLKILFD